jgi:mycothiol synthase
VSLPAGFRLRPARDEDAPTVAAFVNEECIAFLGAPVITTEDLLRDWSAPSAVRENDVAVVEAPGGDLCCWLYMTAERPYTEVFALGAVALPYHGRGLGAAIVAETERRAQRFVALADPAARVVVHAGALADEPRVVALLSASGYREVRRFQLMRVDYAGRPPAPSTPTGIEIRNLRPEQEAGLLYEAHVEAFSDHWGAWEREQTEEAFRHREFERPDFDPTLWFVAWAGDELAGYAGAIEQAAEDPSRGYVRLLGVRRAHRGRGIGEALLRRTFRELHARGKAGCDLHVDSESLTGATRLYERVGMVAHPRFATWEKELRPER